MTLRINRQPPRLVTRALIASFLTVGVILLAVFVLVSVQVRQRVRQAVADNLETAQQVFVQVESRRDQDLFATVSTLAENPTLKAALETYQAERRAGGGVLSEAVSTVDREAQKIAALVGADVLAVADIHGKVLASAGPRAAAFVSGSALTRPASGGRGGDTVVVMPRGAFSRHRSPVAARRRHDWQP